MEQGIILKALSGFYYVAVDGAPGQPVACRARGKFRHQKITPLVGDRVQITRLTDTTGMVDEIMPRKTEFRRPAVANVDQLIIIVSGAVPVTDPFLIDRVVSVAESRGCEPVLCINKCDLNDGRELEAIYHGAGFPVVRLSAKTGQGIDELRGLISGKVSAFTGNSGVGKSSILNALEPAFDLMVGQVSDKLGRGRHTTRHVELFDLGHSTLVADTPGFSSFDSEGDELPSAGELANSFREFRPHLENCRFVGCAHIKEQGCAVLEALEDGKISPSRHAGYVRLYQEVKDRKDWQRK